MIEIQIVYIHIYYLFSVNTFLAVYCTLLNNSYVLKYIFQEKQENKNGKKKRKKEGRKKGPEQDSNLAHSARCDFT